MYECAGLSGLLCPLKLALLSRVVDCLRVGSDFRERTIVAEYSGRTFTI